MSSPPELILVFCPCGALYTDSWRPSLNLSLEDFSDEYVEEVSSTTCPSCKLKTPMGTLLARFENDHLRLDFPLIPKPLPVILYLSRFPKDQPETFDWIKEWVAREGQAGVAKLREILDQRRKYERDTYGEERDSYGVLGELFEVILEWRPKEDLRLENQKAKGPKQRTRKRPAH